MTNTMPSNVAPLGARKWVRSSQGWIAGVCQGLGERWGVSPKVMRILWLLSVFFLGTGVLVYVIAATTLPREDSIYNFEKKKVLGVCLRLSESTGLEVGLVRFLTVFLSIASLGSTIVAYVILYFVLESPTSR